jgi:hypothetical protein
MSRVFRRLIRDRAGNRCEYCHLPQEVVPVSFHIEHIIAKQHGGSDGPDNRCLSCDRCNLNKGPNLSGIDPQSGKIVLLFHPRRQSWKRHFRWSAAILVGRTKTARATIAVLDINNPQRVRFRTHLLAEGFVVAQ